MRKLLLASMLSLGVAGVAFAQPAPGPGPAGGPGPAMMHGPGGPGMWRGHPGGWQGGGMACAVHYGEQNVMLNRVHDRLKITAAEEAAWKNFTTQIDAALAPIGDQCRTAEAPPPPPPATLPDRLAEMQKQAALRAQVFGQVQQAVATMYGQLSPEQKQMADHVMHPPMMGHPPIGHPPVPPAPPAPPAH